MTDELTAGGCIFPKLGALGVDWVFANSGTDFPPIIEGLADAAMRNVPLPVPVTVPHEHAAIGMAHGTYLATGRAQAVMLHTNVGLGNAVTGLINAACDQIPMIVMSGRTPTMEQGRFGARTVPIGWGQEMRDQHGLIRESCKWDYELRFPEQMPELLERAWSIANSSPKGPVYLSLPREVLCEPCPEAFMTSVSRHQPAVTWPHPSALSEAAQLLASAERPVIVSQRGLGDTATFERFDSFVDEWALPVCQYWATQLSVRLDHPMHIGVNAQALLNDADVVLVLDGLTPWQPDQVSLSPNCKVIQAGPDPLFARTPIRLFQSNVCLVGETGDVMNALMDEMDALVTARAPHVQSRHQRVASIAADVQEQVSTTARAGCGSPMTKEWVSLCVGEAIKGLDAAVVGELGCTLGPLGVHQHGVWYNAPFSGGLGWGVPTAMGLQLAAPERIVFATVGDGSYMFANPSACHLVCDALGLPVITLILNNSAWHAVRRAVVGLYPDGKAVSADQIPLTSLAPSPEFSLTAQASGAWTRKVTNGEDFPEALKEAIRVATTERRQVLLDVAVNN